jgi:hypothetical protein
MVDAMPRKGEKIVKKGTKLTMYVPETATEEGIEFMNSFSEKSPALWSFVEEMARKHKQDANLKKRYGDKCGKEEK